MSKNIVLDALIPREDFEVTDESVGTTRNVGTIGVRDLEYDSFFFAALRKPDFQRETNEWDDERIASLIDSFVSGDLIPAVILWRSSSSYTFVIDGAHRLSALAAWVNNDYGDGDISKKFYDGIIPEEQIAAAENTRRLIRKKIGLFSDYQLAPRYPEKVDPQIVEKSKSLGTLAIQVQWVEGDAKKAESSFFKINQQAASIDKTELELLKSRRKPNGIATRAVLRSGKGHKYWSSYDSLTQERIQSLAGEINEILFKPKLNNPIKTLDLPIAGKNFSSQGQPLLLELINKSNGISKDDELPDDSDGILTIKYLNSSLATVRRINSTHPSSLGLHPAVYFYSRDGRHKPASFLAAIDFVKELASTGRFNWFIEVRSKFEDFLLENDSLIQQVVRKYRSASASAPYVKDLYIEILSIFHMGMTSSETLRRLVSIEKFKYLAFGENNQADSEAKNFTKEKKSEIFIRQAIDSAVRCSICGGFLHRNSITIDHIQRKAEGGLGLVDNGQLAHPYCNTTYKN
ncbi:MAG: DUF262 domain-containing protein [Cellvibrio sp.]|uniref:HNH endonuclease family protein n=1 Tax=Cellvibrio sp. TaxID=1965322 RepID=UPI00272019F2|nr:DUF262 domain-containing protein [Cellvibrio sp.]